VLQPATPRVPRYVAAPTWVDPEEDE
jgi:hypothetical protein